MNNHISPSFTAMNYSPNSFIAIAWVYFISGMLFWSLACVVILDEYMGNDLLGRPSQWSEGTQFFSTCLMWTAFVGLVVSYFALMTLTYRCWAIIQDGVARTSPFLAVFLLLVPVVNIVWQFVAWPGLATDTNQYSDRLQANSEYRISTGYGIFTCFMSIGMLILSFFFFVPFAFSLARTAQAIQQKKMEIIAKDRKQWEENS